MINAFVRDTIAWPCPYNLDPHALNQVIYSYKATGHLLHLIEPSEWGSTHALAHSLTSHYLTPYLLIFFIPMRNTTTMTTHTFFHQVQASVPPSVTGYGGGECVEEPRERAGQWATARRRCARTGHRGNEAWYWHGDGVSCDPVAVRGLAVASSQWSSLWRGCNTDRFSGGGQEYISCDVVVGGLCIRNGTDHCVSDFVFIVYFWCLNVEFCNACIRWRRCWIQCVNCWLKSVTNIALINIKSVCWPLTLSYI